MLRRHPKKCKLGNHHVAIYMHGVRDLLIVLNLSIYYDSPSLSVYHDTLDNKRYYCPIECTFLATTACMHANVLLYTCTSPAVSYIAMSTNVTMHKNMANIIVANEYSSI